MKAKDKYITLKEAAEISGYSSDYIGQLIRKGKLPGKQVFSNVAWVTTEEAVRKYAEKKAKAKTHGNWFLALKAKLFSENKLSKFYKISLYIIVALCVVFSLLLFYILAVGVDKNIEKKSLEQVQNDL